jgi:two-component system cell cycle sensor histidine kinase PleC
MFRPVGSERYRDYAKDIHSSGAHLLSLINDLLDVAKIEAGRMDIAPHPLDAGRVFDIALKLINTKAREKDQVLSIKVEPSAPELWADERAVKQILINLVSNAVKFSPAGASMWWAGAPRTAISRSWCATTGPASRPKDGHVFKPLAR